ncbi:MAG: sensor histidine kinase [Gaiellaceae bacterium]
MDDTSFPRLVSLACHDLRTPLATISGFARTLTRQGDMGEPATRYLEIIEQASVQLAELLDELSLASRIESGRYDPTPQSVDTLELARHAAELLGSERVLVSGAGRTIEADVPATKRAVAALVQSALRHGGLDEVAVVVDGAVLTVNPVTHASGPVVLGEDLRDLGAAVAVRLVRRQGGEVSLDGETLRVELQRS